MCHGQDTISIGILRELVKQNHGGQPTSPPRRHPSSTSVGYRRSSLEHLQLPRLGLHPTNWTRRTRTQYRRRQRSQCESSESCTIDCDFVAASPEHDQSPSGCPEDERKRKDSGEESPAHRERCDSEVGTEDRNFRRKIRSLQVRGHGCLHEHGGECAVWIVGSGRHVFGGGGCQCGDCRAHTKQTVEQEGGRKVPAHCKWQNVTPRSFRKIILGAKWKSAGCYR